MTKGKILAFTLLLAFSFESLANDHSSKYSLDENGIYRIDANNNKQIIASPNSEMVFVGSEPLISPNENWALIDYAEAHPGPGRVEEIKALISLQNGEILTAELFKKKYGVWLSALTEWKEGDPATLVIIDEDMEIKL